MCTNGGNHARALIHAGSVASSSSMISALDARKRRPSSWGEGGSGRARTRAAEGAVGRRVGGAARQRRKAERRPDDSAGRAPRGRSKAAAAAAAAPKTKHPQSKIYARLRDLGKRVCHRRDHDVEHHHVHHKLEDQEQHHRRGGVGAVVEHLSQRGGGRDGGFGGDVRRRLAQPHSAAAGAGCRHDLRGPGSPCRPSAPPPQGPPSKARPSRCSQTWRGGMRTWRRASATRWQSPGGG
jgi:hypothetical protein